MQRKTTRQYNTIIIFILILTVICYEQTKNMDTRTKTSKHNQRQEQEQRRQEPAIINSYYNNADNLTLTTRNNSE